MYAHQIDLSQVLLQSPQKLLMQKFIPAFESALVAVYVIVPFSEAAPLQTALSFIFL